MIIIIGSNISEDKLPSFSEYKIIDNVQAAKMTLRVASNPTAIFVHESLSNDFNTPLITQAVRDSFIYFSSDKDLLKKISGISGDDKPVEPVEPKVIEPTETKVAAPKVEVKPPVKVEQKAGVSPKVEIKAPEQKPIETKIAEPKVETKVIEPKAEVKPPVKDTSVTLDKSTPKVSTDSRANKEVTPAVQTIKPQQPIPQSSADIDDITEIEEDDVLSNSFKIPTSLTGNYDAMAAKLKAKEEQLTQFQQMFTEKCAEYDAIIQEQDDSTAALAKTYENKLKEASTAFNKLKNDYAFATSTTGKYHVYAEKSKGVLKEGFAPAEKEVIQNLGLDLRVMCTAGDVTDMHFMMQQNIETFKENYVFVDLTGTHFFDMLYNTNIGGVLKLFNPLTPTEMNELRGSFFRKDNAIILAEYNYHDIMLLDADWVTFFSNLKDLFGDIPIILLFNSISSFSVLYTLSKLSTIFKGYVHLRCNYFSIQNTYTRLRLVPQSRGIKIVATYYFDDVKSVIEELGKKYEVKMSTDVLSLTTIEGKP